MSALMEAGVEVLAPAPEPLSQAQIGRMIDLLQKDMQSKAVWEERQIKRNYNWWDNKRKIYTNIAIIREQKKGKPERRHTDEQIMQVLGLDAKQFKTCLAAHRASQPRGGYTQRLVYAEFSRFVSKYKKWPEMDDFGPSKGKGLCSTWTLQQYVGWQGKGREHHKGKLARMPEPINEASALRWLIHYYCIDKFDKLTPQLILSTPNVTVRRDLMNKYGIEKLLRDGGGTRLREDEFGVLWQLPTDNFNDRATQYVEVTNATARKNLETGELILDDQGQPIYDHYFLRVPPNFNTPKQAVAWTFNRFSHNFNIVAQS